MSSRRPNGSPPLPVRSVRIPRDRRDRAQEQASRDGLTLSAVLNTYLLAYAQGAADQPVLTPTPIPSKGTVTFTWRAADNLWGYFRTRIATEPTHAIGSVINGFLEEYANGRVTPAGRSLAAVAV